MEIQTVSYMRQFHYLYKNSFMALINSYTSTARWLIMTIGSPEGEVIPMGVITPQLPGPTAYLVIGSLGLGWAYLDRK